MPAPFVHTDCSTIAIDDCSVLAVDDCSTLAADEVADHHDAVIKLLHRLMVIPH